MYKEQNSDCKVAGTAASVVGFVGLDGLDGELEVDRHQEQGRQTVVERIQVVEGHTIHTGQDKGIAWGMAWGIWAGMAWACVVGEEWERKRKAVVLALVDNVKDGLP
jgi:hypothetical protein